MKLPHCQFLSQLDNTEYTASNRPKDGIAQQSPPIRKLCRLPQVPPPAPGIARTSKHQASSPKSRAYNSANVHLHRSISISTSHLVSTTVLALPDRRAQIHTVALRRLEQSGVWFAARDSVDLRCDSAGNHIDFDMPQDHSQFG